MKQSSVAIVDTSKLFREGLQGLLRRSRFSVVISAGTLLEAMEGFSTGRPELIVYSMDNNDAPALLAELRALMPDLLGLRTVLITNPLSGDLLREAAAAGVKAVLSKEITGEVLQRSLELVMLGQQLFPGLPDEPPPRPAASLIPFTRPKEVTLNAEPSHEPGFTSATDAKVRPMALSASASRITVLSDRERQILRCLVNGAANKTIARDLLITEATVKVHIKGLLRKIRVNNRTQAAVWGLNNVSLMDGPSMVLLERTMDHPVARQAAAG